MTRPGVNPFFAYDANYLIDNKAGIIIDAEGTRANRTVEIAVTQTMMDRVSAASIFGPRGSRATRLMARSGCSSGWWIATSRRIFRYGTSRHAPMAPSAGPTSSLTDAQHLHCPGGEAVTSTGTSIDGQYVHYQCSKDRLLICSFKTQCCPDSGRAARSPRDLHEDARDVARALANTRAFRTITPRAQKGRDAVCAHEAHLQA